MPPASTYRRSRRRRKSALGYNPRMPRTGLIALILAAAVVAAPVAQKPAQKPAVKPSAAAAKLDALKQEAAADVESRSQFSQQMVDQIFSYGELGLPGVRDQSLPDRHPEEERVRGAGRRSPASRPSFMATWGSGQAGDRARLRHRLHPAGVAEAGRGVSRSDHRRRAGPRRGAQLRAGREHHRRDRREEDHGARAPPGHDPDLAGRRRRSWSAAKAYYIRAGLFKDVDVALFTHVGDDARRVVGRPRRHRAWSRCSTASRARRAHAAAQPVARPQRARRRRADGRRLELPPRAPAASAQRSHYVITDGGDQPNVVPRTASVWYYFRQTDVSRTSRRCGRSATPWPRRGDDDRHGAAADQGARQRLAAALQPGGRRNDLDANIQKVGMPTWSDGGPDAGARRFRRNWARARGADDEAARQPAGPGDATNTGGGSDDIGDISWNVPTVTLNYPSNIPGLPGHNWANAISMATPIAHKGVTAGAKVQAMTILDLLLAAPSWSSRPWTYFRNVQTKDTEVRAAAAPAGSAGDRAEQGNHGEVPRPR